jgi:excisionase family DNA binding protein
VDTPRPPILIEKEGYSVLETAHAIGLGRNKTLELIHSGRLRHVRVGRRIIVPRTAVAAFLEAEAA